MIDSMLTSFQPALPRIVLITPVRDEVKYIGGMIESIAAQTVLPVKWIIVDDGSTDGTQKLVRQFAEKLKFIELVELPSRAKRLAGGETALAQALKQVVLADFDFIARFDADLLLENSYLENILKEFEADPTLGIAGGGLYIEQPDGNVLEKAPEYHVRGALKMYRRCCYEDIGGLMAGIGWDTVDEVSAWTRGWNTRSFFHYRVIHRRPTGKGIRSGRLYWERGKAEYVTWSHPLFALVKSIKVARDSKSISMPVCFLTSFTCSYFNGTYRVEDPQFAKIRHKQQLWQVTQGLPQALRRLLPKAWKAREAWRLSAREERGSSDLTPVSVTER